ncbi:YncE family protein [Stygiolobus sp. CP8521M]|uniref:YncE family protein n=1 Tax=Stygiolobus sp. CP8521M TaxID=3133136 RepID=UPI00307E9A7D
MSKPVGNIVNEINLGEGEPTSILYDPKNGYTYVGFAALNYSESGIYVIANYTEVSKIPTLPPPRIMCYNPQNGDVYVDLGSSISVIDGTTIVSNITLNGSISTMLYDRLNGILYVSVNSFTNDSTINEIYAINVSNNMIIGHVIIGNLSSYSMVLDPSNGYIYVSRYSSIIVLTPNLEIVGTINVNTSVLSMLYDPVNGYIYAFGIGYNGLGDLVVINPSNNSVIGFLQNISGQYILFSKPLLTYNPSNGYVYVVSGNYISVISSNNLVAEIPIGSLTFAVTYSPENSYVYVSADGMISVIDPEYNYVISNLTAPNNLQNSLMTYGNGYIYVADFLTNYTNYITQVIIIGVQSAQKEEGSLVVNVYNYTLGSPVVGGITYGLLINSENQVVEKAYINSYSQLVFTNVTPGQYVVDVYHIPSSGMNITEYWGNITVNVTSLPYTVNFIRNAPIIYSLNYTLANGMYNINAVIYNPRNYSIEAIVYFYTPSSLIPASIERYLAPGYNYFSLGIPSGTPYVDVVVSAYLSNYLGTPIPTDEKVLRFVTETPIELNPIPYFYNSSAMGAVYLNFTQAELELFMPPVMLGNLSIPGILDFNNMSYFAHTLEGPYVFNTTLGSWKVYGFTFIALPTYNNGSVVNSTYMLQKTMIIAYNGEKVIVLLYYRNLAPVPLELNQYWSHIHKGVDGLYFTVLPNLFNPYVKATEQVIQDAYYIDGKTSLYINGNYLGKLDSFGLWQVLPVGPITLIDNVSGWDIQLIPINNLSTTQQIQLVTNGFSIDNVTIANSFLNIQHAKITLLPNQSAQYVYSIGINTQSPNYTEISGILSYLIQIASSSVPHNTTPQTLSSLSVKVFNVLGRLATTVPGVVLGVLYNSSGFKEVVYMNSSGYLNFYNVPPGTYTLEVYHYPNIGLNLTEYWGGMTVNLQPGSNFVTFYRHEPWIYNLQVSASNREIVVTVTANGTVTSPTLGEIELWVTNNPSLASPYSPSKVFNVTINPGLNTFNFTYPVSQAGTYYVYAAVLTHISIYTVTDQWNWTATTIIQPPTTHIEVYSQFVKYFYSGFNLTDRFFVAAPSINGNQPSSVTGYIGGSNVTLSFTYNTSSGYWVSNEVNMGGLKPGSYELTVYAVYGNNNVVEGTYSIIVLEPPPIVLAILYNIPIPDQASELNLSKLSGFSIPLDIGYEWSLEKNITGLFNNTYEIKAKVILKYELEQNIPVNYLSGNYSILLEYPIPVTLDSNGTVSIAGSISKNLVLRFGPADAAFTIGGSAQGNLAISNYQVLLQSIDASAFLSAYGTFNVPTPWGISIDDIGAVGATVSISLGASAHVKAVLIPANNPNSTIPLAFENVSGNVFIPFGIEGSLSANIFGFGAAGGLQGAAGVGFLLQPNGSSLLESPGGAMVGEVNAFVVANLIIFNYQGSWTILGPGVLYEWGSVPNSDIASFEDELQQAAQQFQQQILGSDWVNGSTFGIITNNTRFGYGYSITNYNGLVYIYYTELMPSGVAVIKGLVFNGTTAVKAPLPVFNDLGEGSPLLITLSNGSLMMIWGGVPMGHYGLNNLTILLQASVLHGNTWGPVVNLTTSGDAMSYASDGKYIYLVYEPKVTLTYNNTILEELTPTGVVVRALSIPRVVGITGAWNGLVIVQFTNGTYALVNMNTGVVEPIYASIAGFSSDLLYHFYNGTLTVVNGTQRLEISLPIYAYAFPVVWSHGLVIIAWRPGLLSVFNWNGTVLQPISNYTTAFTIIPRASIIDNTLYLTWFGLMNTTNGHGTIYMAIQPLPHPTNQSTTTTTTTVNVTTTTSSVNTSTTSVTTTTTNTTEITQIPVGPSAPIVQSNNNNFNMLPILVLVILVVVLAVIIILYKRLK